MRIQIIKLRNFKGVDRDIVLDGDDAVILGQNGTGKSTIADAYSWLFTGKLSNGKTGKVRKIVEGRECGDNPSVEVTFTNGVSYFKELVRQNNSDKAVYKVGGLPIKESEFKAHVDALVSNSAFTLLSNLFAPVNLHWELFRRLLIQVVGDIQNSDVICTNADFNALAVWLKDYSIDETISILKADIRAVKAQADSIPAAIKENQRQIDSITGDRNALLDEIAKLQNFDTDIADAVTVLQVKILNAERQLDDLKRKWQALKAETPGKCPTCGQDMNVEAWRANHDARLVNIVNDGKYFKAQLTKYKAELAILNVDSSAIDRLVDAKTKLKRLDDRDTLISRNSQLQADFDALNKTRSHEEYLLALADDFKLTQATLLQDKINSAFDFVSFKMFEHLKNGEIKACCEPMLDGVPYSQLSSGEKFKAACDILKTLQEHFGVELPLFIDDAESYTANSNVDLPNQIIRLVAVDEVDELQISVFDKNILRNRRASA